MKRVGVGGRNKYTCSHVTVGMGMASSGGVGGSAVSLMELSTDEAIINIPFSLCPGHVTHLQTLNNTSYSK